MLKVQPIKNTLVGQDANVLISKLTMAACILATDRVEWILLISNIKC
jgi:hypothetical protein